MVSLNKMIRCKTKRRNNLLSQEYSQRRSRSVYVFCETHNRLNLSFVLLEIATDTVCVIGIVNVKVIGSVQNGERIYASMNYPGKAVPQSHLPISRFSRKQHFLLGMALESKFSISFEHEHLVKCFVCIVLDISRKEIQDEVERMCKMTEKLTSEHVRRSQKKTYESKFEDCQDSPARIGSFAQFAAA